MHKQYALNYANVMVKEFRHFDFEGMKRSFSTGQLSRQRNKRQFRYSASEISVGDTLQAFVNVRNMEAYSDERLALAG